MRFRFVWWALGLAVLAGLVFLMATTSTGPADPTEAHGPQSHATVVFDSAVIVFREGLEAILIFAAVTASLLGANRGRRRPVAAGAGVAFAATIATWFLVQALLEAAAPLGARLEAITGFVAIAVLLVVMNWFVHNVYWSQWIGRHHRQRRKVLERGTAVAAGLVALGFTSVYREGFEVVLFLPADARAHRRAAGGRAGRDDRRHRAELPGPRMAALDAAPVRGAGLARRVVRGLRHLTRRSPASSPRRSSSSAPTCSPST